MILKFSNFCLFQFYKRPFPAKYFFCLACVVLLSVCPSGRGSGGGGGGLLAYEGYKITSSGIK